MATCDHSPAAESKLSLGETNVNGSLFTLFFPNWESIYSLITWWISEIIKVYNGKHQS